MAAVLTSKQIEAKSATAATGEDKNYWTVELVRPKGASPGLLAFISFTETAIQSAVNLLGIGTTSPPPNVDDLVQPVQYENLGKSAASEDYQETLALVEARQSALIRADRNVVDVSKYVSDEDDMTLKAIKHIVSELNTTKLAGPQLIRDSDGNLTGKTELEVLGHLAEAIEAVYLKVTVVATENAKVAGEDGSDDDGKGSGGGGDTADGAGGGGGGDGLAGLLPILAMLPMAAMPLISSLAPELMDRVFGEDEPSEEDSEKKDKTEPSAKEDSPDSSGDDKAEDQNGDDDKAEGQDGKEAEPAQPAPILPQLLDELAGHVGLT
ncbi:hypothetical protein HLB23_06275 [Nocardia uniformis]|uniref:Uncharacterized protein n=1 Tax=Nocardia uniformis TaxID=53432 RepID=A0A849C3D7_9NOCA|nr:hypothetical protein [Nocardia uniformis]NNH69479.1 hypothetical protein [Nocardia uniformis]